MNSDAARREPNLERLCLPSPTFSPATNMLTICLGLFKTIRLCDHRRLYQYGVQPDGEKAPAR